jgi:hypothetical protein
MRILLDTYILIPRENDKILSVELQELLRILSTNRIEIMIHPLSVVEIEKDKDKERKQIMISKLNTYPRLDPYPNLGKDRAFLDSISVRHPENERTDLALIHSVYKDAVDFLITEDRGIHKSAKILNLTDRVLLIDDALQIFRKYGQKEKLVAPPALKEVPVNVLDLDDPIFDKLKKDYDEFHDWFRRISKAGRKCWVYCAPGDNIGALLIYKIEDEPIDSTPPFPRRKRLKISTFIVTHVGQKIGELFIKMSVDLSVKNGIDEIYFTHFTEEEDHLIDLVHEYGFENVAKNTRGEDIYLKRLTISAGDNKQYNRSDIGKVFYPTFYDGSPSKKFIVPIWPEYHRRLFTDYGARQTSLHEHDGEFIIEGNTIKKAYIFHPRTRRIGPGDILLFYQSRSRMEITSLGVVEEIHYDQNEPEKIMRLVGKRTVYTKKEIIDMVKSVGVILFRHHFHLKTALRYNLLKKEGILKGAPRSVVEIEDSKYRTVKSWGGIDERFAIH